MYLAKFFHRAPGDNDKELLFIPGDEPIVIGIHMHGDDKIGEDEFLREEFSDIRAAVTVFRRHAAELAAAGATNRCWAFSASTSIDPPQARPWSASRTIRRRN